MGNYTDEKFWDNYFSQHKHNLAIIESSLFSDMFNRYLVADPQKTVLEIGCADSSFLCYLSKKFGYKACGLDFTESINRTKDLFKFNSLPEPILYREDFFKWRPDKKFDVVCSFGFIEHFENISDTISRHVDLIVPGGKLLITLPHFAHGQYLLHWLIDRENLKKHNTKIMNLDSIRYVFSDLPVKVDYLSYYKTFGFWTERTEMAAWERFLNWSILKFGKIINKIFGYDKPNSLFSPHIVCIATKI